MDREKDQENRDDKKIGVYICHCGGNISDHVDVDEVAEKAGEIPGVASVHTNPFMCSDPGQELIRKDIETRGINRVVVASCAPSLHELTFRSAIKRSGMNPFLYEHANIREQVSWVHHGKKATEKAAVLVSAAIAKAGELESLDPVRVDAKNHATVIGGGVAGMRCALDLSRRGIDVVLVEKSEYLGGRTASLARLFPTDAPAESIIAPLARAVVDDPGIRVMAHTQVSRCEGYVGNFTLSLQTRPGTEPDSKKDTGAWVPFSGFHLPAYGDGSKESTLQTGVVVLATGFSPYTPSPGEYGYLEHSGVMTLPALLEEMGRHPSEGRQLVIQGRPIRRMAFIHCVGSRQIPGIHEPGPGKTLNEYCSRTCCTSVLRAAVEIREKHPQTCVLDCYRDIRTYGRGQEAYYDRASENQVLFMRFEPESPPVVEPVSNGPYPLRVRVQDTLTFGEELFAEVDLVVLAVGMEARPIPTLVEMMKLPLGMDRFLQEVHPKLRPVEVANNGILLAGTCQAPMDIREACAAAQAAAVKAAGLLGKGYVELDPYVAHVDPEKCKGHGNCVKACPVQNAVTMEKGKADINPALCTGCGICVAECPENAVNVKGWTLSQYEKMVDAIAAA